MSSNAYLLSILAIIILVAPEVIDFIREACKSS